MVTQTTQHTPGDGIANYGADRFEVIKGGRRWAVTDTLEAARIADAAPDLLAALEAALSDADLHDVTCGWTDKAKAAIAKARGQ
jgi:hypothetical protein